MARFQTIDAYAPGDGQLSLLPLRFERLSAGRVVVANAVGDLLVLSQAELDRLVALALRPGDGLYERATERLLVAREGAKAPLQLLALRLRSRMAFLRDATALHILVVTLRCEHSCPYCQVSRRNTGAERYDMSEETALLALEVAMDSPSKAIKVEFQGGEPLLNFPLIRFAVEAAERMATVRGKVVEFVIATNLALLDDEILTFCRDHHIHLSTSLDGPADLHNRNRPRPGGNSHALAVAGIQRVQEVLGRDRVGALMTTTDASLDRVEEIIDEYVGLGLDGVFLRPLSPYGFAMKTRWYDGYDSDRWLAFYERGLRHILDLNHRGIRFPEFYASLLLQRILTDQPIGYVDLRSPAGIGIGALVYNYDGKVFASDEGRMLAEMGDRTFELGKLGETDYASLVTSERLIDLVGGTLSQTSPECATCAYEAHCGADPVYHHATQGDAVGIKPLSGFCARQKGILRLLLEILDRGGKDAAVLRSWVSR
ncbi:His-Xaa-Ser system radical SAM maturase HxsB [Pararoseomonas sp. SCSIO 73927]|uniref:His-Xaa-Ser system radical SAM maturase HxsB n=1 Tax=Pararoseomonas sp. SCSIO 73927 TaxID=3114537 RepID=UPI0030D2A73A